MSLSDEDDIDAKNSCPEYMAWLSSLSHSELDMLISLKQMAIQRAKVIGCQSMGNKFDVKILRALGVMLREYIKERVKSVPSSSSMAEAPTVSNGCHLATSNHEGDFESMGIEDVTTSN
ncbi:uncharacterized protein LOC143854383 isoform X2 [Tasmannia lanceolata]|uniref:uncharacterized protein LOC143854383 isoform X2 n=1 Tax=Tasmannia lanceolata TaxID=3420 RepID=UPI0040643D0C